MTVKTIDYDFYVLLQFLYVSRNEMKTCLRHQYTYREDTFYAPLVNKGLLYPEVEFPIRA